MSVGVQAIANQAAEYWKGVVEKAMPKSGANNLLNDFQKFVVANVLENLKQKKAFTISCGQLVSDSLLESAAKNAGFNHSISSLKLPDLITRVSETEFSPRELYRRKSEEAKESSAS